MRGSLLGTVAAAALVALACSDLNVPEYNNPTPGGIAGDPVAGLQLAATGILREHRSSFSGWVQDAASFGREGMDYFPTDGRAYSHYVTQNPLDPAGFAAGLGAWTFRHRNLRNIHNFLATIDAAGGLSDGQKEAARGFAKTLHALEVLYTVMARHNHGAVTGVNDDPKVLAPFVTRDAGYDFVVSKLDEARNHLVAAGSTPFPFALHAGFTGFSTPATFLQFNRAIMARTQVYRASLGNAGCGANGATCYQAALTALGESFINGGASTPAALAVGVSHVYSSESGDTRLALNHLVDPDFVAHPTFVSDAESGDARLAKVAALPAPRSHVGGEGPTTSWRFNVYPADNSPAPIIKNEELILLRAEARYFTGDLAGALTDINLIRTVSGGLGARIAFTSAADFVTELLHQRRYSLVYEGHRWVDVRRFDRLSDLPLDGPATTHFLHQSQPIPQGECIYRASAESGLQCPAQVP